MKTTYLFDFDGTLVDSSLLHDRAFREVLLEELPGALPLFDYDRVRGRATREVFLELGVAGTEDLHRLTVMKQRRYQQAVRQGELRVLPGAAEVLAALSKAGRDLYLVTSGGRGSVELALESTGLAVHFRGIVTASDVDRSKPAPDLYLEALRRFKLDPDKCLAIEDAPSGAESARAAGLDVVMVDPLSSVDSLLALVCDLQPVSRTCAVIPAAGLGSRLGLDRPKILADVDEENGATIWSILSSTLKPFTDRIQVVLSPSGVDWFAGIDADIVIQDLPLGMGDAVFRGAPAWAADRILVVWGDQVNLSSETFERTLEAHSAAAQPAFVLPRVWNQKPYVQYDFDERGDVIGVRQTREGDQTDSAGWSDVGLFCLSTAELEPLWREYLATAARGGVTGEINFLPFLPFLSSRGWTTGTVEITDPDEARGVNTPADLDFARDRWRRVTEARSIGRRV